MLRLDPFFWCWPELGIGHFYGAQVPEFFREGPGHRPKGLSQQITTFVQTFSLFKPVPSPFWKMAKSILLFKYLNILVRALITKTSSTWVYHTMPNMSYTLKTYVKHRTRVLPKDWTRNLETYSTALWPLGYSNWWLCSKVSNLGLMFVSVRDLYNFFYIESV